MKALILTGKYAQDIEVFYPLYRMQEEGWEVDIVMPDREALGVYGMKIVGARPLAEIQMFNFWQVLILPGGARAMEYLRTNNLVIEAIQKCFENGAVIGSICHGAQLLISAGLVKGRTISGYYSIKDDIVNAGGTWPGSYVDVDPPFVTDGRIVTSPHYKYLGPWMREVIRVALS